MANNYTDHAELRFELNHPLMKRIVELKERNFRDKDEYDYAPENFEDAMDSYDRVLGIVGDITATTIAAVLRGQHRLMVRLDVNALVHLLLAGNQIFSDFRMF